VIPSMKGCLRRLFDVEELLVTPLVLGVGLYSLFSFVSLAAIPLVTLSFLWLASHLQSFSLTLRSFLKAFISSALHIL